MNKLVYIKLYTSNLDEGKSCEIQKMQYNEIDTQKRSSEVLSNIEII